MILKYLSKTFSFLFTIILSANLFSQPKFLERGSSDIPNSILNNLQNEHRRVINLNGMWDVQSDEPFFRISVRAPFCYDFKGIIDCFHSFNLNDTINADNWNFILYCDGINYQCEIFINDRFITKHEGGFTPFSSVIQEGILKPKGNSIEIKIDNTLDFSKTLPLKNNINFPKNYGGIHRDIYLIAVPKIFIRNINLTSEIDINFNADIKNTVTISSSDISKVFPEKNFNIKTEILDSSGNVKVSSEPVSFSISSNSTIQISNNLSLSNPDYWSYSEPNVYTVRVILSSSGSSVDIYKTEFGIFEWRFSPSNNLIINKKEIFLKGINYIEEFPGKGICGEYEEIEKDILQIKSLGCNSIKVLGRPASPYLIQICSRLGILVFEELPIFNIPSEILSSENFTALAGNQLSEMITAHKNSPAVIAYGLGNDFDVTSEAAKVYLSKLTTSARTLDRRIIYYSTRNYLNDKCRNISDMTGINLYDNDQNVLKNIIADIKMKKGKIFIANFGKQIDPVNFAGYSDPNSLESQAKFIVDDYKLIKNSSLTGGFYLSYSDWNSDFPNLRHFVRQNPFLKTTGIYSLERNSRTPAAILKKVFTDEDVPNLNIGSYSPESPLIFIASGIIIFILFIYLANSFRKLRENIWRSLLRPFNFFTDVREQNLISPLYNFMLCIILSLGSGLFFASLLYYWRSSQLFDIVLSQIVSNENLKILAGGIINSPLKLALMLSALTFIKLFIISVVIWLFSLTLKFRVRFNNIYTVTVWGFLPNILLLVAGTFYYRALTENPEFALFGIILVVLLNLLSFYRILKGIYIIFDASIIKTYFYGIATVVVVYGALWYYLNSTRYLMDFIRMVKSFSKY